MMRSFYNKRNFEYAWFSGDGVTEEALSFSTFYKYDADTGFSKSLQYLLDDLAAEDSIKLTEKNQAVAKTELQLTKRFLQYFIIEKKFKPEAIQLFIPAKKSDVLYTADSLLQKKNNTFNGNVVYEKLLEQLKKYTALAKKGGWPTLTFSSLKYNDKNSSNIAQLKKRLHITGEYALNDTTGTMNDTLDAAIKLFQTSHGYKPTGKWNNELLREMNITAMQRVQQLIINLQRMKWMPVADNGKLIVVNLPEYVLYAYNAKQKVFAMPVVVGKEGHNTIMFLWKAE